MQPKMESNAATRVNKSKRWRIWQTRLSTFVKKQGLLRSFAFRENSVIFFFTNLLIRIPFKSFLLLYIFFCVHVVNSDANRKGKWIVCVTLNKNVLELHCVANKIKYCLACRHVSMVAKRWDDIKFCFYLFIFADGDVKGVEKELNGKQQVKTH